MYKFLPIFIFISFFSFSQSEFSPAEKPVEYRPMYMDESIKADGKLDESIWRKVKPLFLAYQVEPFQGNQASFRTEVKIVYDHKFLYVGATLYDTIGRNNFRAPNLKRDYEFLENDLFGIALDGFSDKRNALVLQSNAYGAQRDLLSFDDRQFDIDWDGLYRVRTQRSDTAWVAEFAIPWQTLRYPNTQTGESQDWGINFFRVRRSSNELSVWSPHPRAMSALRMDYAGILRGIIPPPPTKTNIRFVPYLLHDTKKTAGTEIGNTSSNQFKLGGEVKWAISPTSILDLTFNTDFAQADVDRQVNNISRFSVFFPERRQFFLENASLFSNGLAPVDEVVGGSMYIQPFFSRRIGLDANAQAIPITAGSRFVYRSEKRNIGLIAMRQGLGDGDVFTNFGVARYSENLGQNSRLGGLVTMKQSPSGQQTTSSIDGFVRFNDLLSFSGMASTTQDTKTNQFGFSEYTQFIFRSNKNTIYWTQTIVSENYDPAMGFVARRNVLSNSQGIDFNIRKAWLPKFIRNWGPGVYTELYHSLKTGKLVEQRILTGPLWLNLQNGGTIGTYIESSVQNLEEPFRPVGIQISPGSFRYTRGGFVLANDPSAKYFFSMNYDVGGYYNGNLRFLDLKTRLAPIPHVNIGLTFNRSNFSNVGDFQVSKQVDLLLLETRFAINPRVQLIGFYQKNTTDNLNAINLRFAWEYQPLSYVYLVFNQSDFSGGDLTQQKTRAFLTKLSFLKQF
jgi:hypothetical protein